MDEASWLSKNVYNCTTYLKRQAYVADQEQYEATGQWGKAERQLTYGVLYKQVREIYPAAYMALPKCVAHETIKQVVRDWKSYKASAMAFYKNPHKYKARPQLPGYKHKTHGRALVKYEKEAVSRNKRNLGQGILKLSQLPIAIEVGNVLKRIREVERLADDAEVTLYDHLVAVRIVPQSNGYQVELVYKGRP